VREVGEGVEELEEVDAEHDLKVRSTSGKERILRVQARTCASGEGF
jgi:hypothetical protein